ncbi:hypothetical protein A5735_01875 [Mycolicibacter heraklionensis]|nr:hypothetical protein A5735_01875 [Mycolicibacter heraklionensis]
MQGALYSAVFLTELIDKEDLDRRFSKRGTTGPDNFFHDDEELAAYIESAKAAAAFLVKLREAVGSVKTFN